MVTRISEAAWERLCALAHIGARYSDQRKKNVAFIERLQVHADADEKKRLALARKRRAAVRRIRSAMSKI